MKALLLAALFCASFAWAQERQIQYQEKILPFSQWASQYPQERNVLGLYKDYKEPTVAFIEDGVPKTRVATMMIYIVGVRATVNKNAANINLPNLIKLESLKQLDLELKHKQISESELMPKVVGKGPITNFAWCDGAIKLPQYETNLSHVVGPRPWCQADGRTMCVESCFIFNTAWQAGVGFYNQTKKTVSSNPADQKDYGLGMQAEARYYVSDAEFGQPVKELTKVSTPVRGIVELNIFYVNQAMVYGKVVAVFQEHPQNAQATVVTTLAAFGVQDKTWKKVGEVLKGKSRFNTSTGITAGIPVFTKNIANSLANMLEK